MENLKVTVITDKPVTVSIMTRERDELDRLLEVIGDDDNNQNAGDEK